MENRSSPQLDYASEAAQRAASPTASLVFLAIVIACVADLLQLVIRLRLADYNFQSS